MPRVWCNGGTAAFYILFYEVSCIKRFVNLDWFRFHGKQFVIEQLQSQGFYDIKIHRKIDIELGASFIKIEAISLSVEKGAVYGYAKIYDDQIIHSEDECGEKIRYIIQNEPTYQYSDTQMESKPKYYYSKNK